MDALPFLSGSKIKLGPLYVVHGDEPFLKRLAIQKLRKLALGENLEEQTVSTYAGDKATFAEVFDDLDTVPFFDPKRVVIVESADPFVTKHRAELETRLTRLPETGLLILDVKSWASTTRLAKLVADSATIVCKALPSNSVVKWCSTWSESQYQKQLASAAANLLVDHVGTDMGLLDQELNKLAIYVGTKAKIAPEDVDRLVGNSRAENVWKMFDLIGGGDVKGAFAILERLFDQGEEPYMILGALASQLRKLAQAARLSGQGQTLGLALEQAGVKPFAIRGAEQLLRHLGRRRLDRIYDGLLQMNLDLRGNSPLPPRTLFERFLLQLARKNPP
jgi:DNA polymerase-3 subunit delta